MTARLPDVDLPDMAEANPPCHSKFRQLAERRLVCQQLRRRFRYRFPFFHGILTIDSPTCYEYILYSPKGIWNKYVSNSRGGSSKPV